MLMFIAFTIVCEHGGIFLSSSLSLLRKHIPWQVPTLGLCCTRSFVGMVFCSSSVVFLGLGSSPPPGVFIVLPLSFWPHCDGCYSGGLGTGVLQLGWGLVGLWVFFCLGL